MAVADGTVTNVEDLLAGTIFNTVLIKLAQKPRIALKLSLFSAKRDGRRFAMIKVTKRFKNVSLLNSKIC